VKPPSPAYFIAPFPLAFWTEYKGHGRHRLPPMTGRAGRAQTPSPAADTASVARPGVRAPHVPRPSSRGRAHAQQLRRRAASMRAQTQASTSHHSNLSLAEGQGRAGREGRRGGNKGSEGSGAHFLVSSGALGRQTCNIGFVDIEKL